jgi:hypothetical protein
MKKKTKSLIITIVILAAIAVIAVLALTKHPAPSTDAETAKCIGSKSLLYVQLGCSHCKDQEDMFGENVKYLKMIDCFYERQACIDANITGTPTWTINGEKYLGVQSIDKLKELTGC